MKIFFLLFTYLLSILATAQTIEIDGKEVSWSDLAHPNRGCPENSTCSKPMGEKILKFKNFLQANKDKKNFSNLLEDFRKKNGLPIQFLMQGENISLDPVIWDSRCELHRSKDKAHAVLKAMLFFHNNPKSELIVLDSAWVGEKRYEVPYEAGPILIEHDE